MLMIDAAAGSANSYSESLAGMSEKLGQSKDREGLRALPNTALHSAIVVADHEARSTGEHLGHVTVSIGVATLKAHRHVPLCRQAARA